MTSRLRCSALQHRSEGIVGGDPLARTSPILRGRLPVSECEADKETLAHFFFAISHRLQRLLLFVDFFILGHVGLVAEVVEVACVCFRVQLRDEWRSALSQGVPLNFGKILMFVDILDVGESTTAGVDATAPVSFQCGATSVCAG